MPEAVFSLDRTPSASREARERVRALAPARVDDAVRLVDTVADRWGVERGSTRVWFELDR